MARSRDGYDITAPLTTQTERGRCVAAEILPSLHPHGLVV
jgi:hypothetical protein